jgi:hypothetical protein
MKSKEHKKQKGKRDEGDNANSNTVKERKGSITQKRTRLLRMYVRRGIISALCGPNKK